MRWVQALPPQYVAQLKQADDSMLTQFAKILTQNVLLLEQADSAKIDITPEEWQGLQARYRSPARYPPRRNGSRRRGPGRLQRCAAAERSKVAALKVEQYFDRLVGGKSRLRPLPSALATVLRDRSSYRVHDAGINRAIELAQAEQAKADSARQAAGPMQPAPGPAPIPGVGSDSAARARPAPRDAGTEAPPGTGRARRPTPPRAGQWRHHSRAADAAIEAAARCRSAVAGAGHVLGRAGSSHRARFASRADTACMPPRTRATVAPAHDTTFTVDRVLAVVGNRPVLASQVEEEIFSRESQGAKLPDRPRRPRGRPAADRGARSSMRSCWCSRPSATRPSR